MRSELIRSAPGLSLEALAHARLRRELREHGHDLGESEGVLALPGAQRDRFRMKLGGDYPTRAQEAEAVRRMGVRPP